MERDDVFQKIILRVPAMTITGKLDFRNMQDRRTINYLNKTPKFVGLNVDPVVEGFVMLHDFQAFYKGKKILKSRKKKVRKDNIIFAYDEFVRLGDDRIASQSLIKDQPKRIGILTKAIGARPFYIKGSAIAFERKFNDPSTQFIPLTEPSVKNIVARMKKRDNALLELPFLALNKDYIQAYGNLD